MPHLILPKLGLRRTDAADRSTSLISLIVSVSHLLHLNRLLFALFPCPSVFSSKTGLRIALLSLQPIYPRIYIAFEPTHGPTAGPSKFDRLREFACPPTSEKSAPRVTDSIQNFR